MARYGSRRAGGRWRGWLACLLLPAQVALAAPSGGSIDQAWRDRFVMGSFADAMRHAARAEKRAAAALEAAKGSNDPRTRLRAAADYLMATSATATDCRLTDESLTLARSLGPAYERELFDLSAAASSVNREPCKTELTAAEFDALGQRLGDPARQYFVLQAKAAEARRAGRFNDALQFTAQQREQAITDVQTAYALYQMALTDSVSTALGDRTDNMRGWLQQALALVEHSDFEAIRASIMFMLFRVEFGAGHRDTAFALMNQVQPLLRGGALGDETAAFTAIQFALALAIAGRLPQALALYDEGARWPTQEPNTLAMRNSTLLEILSRVKTPEAHRRGLEALQQLQQVMADPAFGIPSRVAMSKRYAARFHEAFGDYREALAALKAANEAGTEAQALANETARAELREKLDVAAKEQENARLKADAELQAARQRGWIVAFAIAAVGVLATGAALALAVRRGRRLAAVSAELAQRNTELEQLSASRIRMLAAACHDLRQPAHALGMLAELGADAQRDPDRFGTWLARVQRSTAALAEMLDELMDLGRLDGGHYAPQLSPVSMQELLQEVKLHFEGLAARKGLRLEVLPAPGLAEVDIVSDRHLLRRIVFNLVSNAVKYTDTGFVRVKLSADATGRAVQLAVQDSGPGIPPDKLDDVFRDYVRLNPMQAAEGLGIGLSIVRRASELLGHSLQLVSPPGEGTTVSLRLPLSDAPPAAAAAPASPPVAMGHGPRGVLAVLENDVDVREAMAALLRRWGYTVHAGGDAQALLAQFGGGETPDLVVTDLHLDGSDGLAELARLRQALHLPGLPALLVTGDLDAAITEQAQAAQVCVAHKPLAPRKLSALVQRLLTPPAGDGNGPGALTASA